VTFLASLFPRDKNLHILVGASAFLVAALLAHVLGAPWYVGAIVGLACTYVVGVWKELYDSFRPSYHTCDEWDYRATMSGGVALALVHVFVQLWWVRFA
jgi:ABC-type transport system involved in cytochrome c biogenesis permease subunit